MATEPRRAKRKPQLSGWCGIGSPRSSHQRCIGGNSANPDREWQPCPCPCHGDGVPVPSGTWLGVSTPEPSKAPWQEEIEPDEPEPEPEDDEEFECGECGEQVIEREDGTWVHYFTDEEECG